MRKEMNQTLRRHLLSLFWTFFTLLGIFFILFFIDEVVRSLQLGDYITYLLWGIIIAICCFFIIKYDPQSIWYVPLISNSVFIPVTYNEIFYWGSPVSVSLLFGVIASVIASIIGYRIGKRRMISPAAPVKRA